MPPPARAHGRSRPGAQVLMGPESIAIIAETGDDLTASGVRNHRQLTLTGPVVPAEFNAILHETLHERRHRLFVRMPGGLLDLGPGRCRRSRWSGIDPVLHHADIRLDQPLCWETLDVVRPPAPPAELAGIAWLDHLNDDPPRALIAELGLGAPEDDACMVSVAAADRSVLRPLRALDLDWIVFDG